MIRIEFIFSTYTNIFLTLSIDIRLLKYIKIWIYMKIKLCNSTHSDFLILGDCKFSFFFEPLKQRLILFYSYWKR